MKKQYRAPKMKAIKFEMSHLLCSSDFSKVGYYNNEYGRGRQVRTDDAL